MAGLAITTRISGGLTLCKAHTNDMNRGAFCEHHHTLAGGLLLGTLTVVAIHVQCSLHYTEHYHLDYTENKAHSLGVRKTVSVLSHKLSKPLMTSWFR